jgi:DNA polymerase-3 subunit delta
MLGSVASERELKPVYLFSGSDQPKIALALGRLRQRIGEDATEHLHASEANGEDAIAACNSLGLFVTEARAVLVDGVEAWKSADAKEIEAYLASPAPATVLALVGEGLKKDSPLAKTVAKTGEVHFYEVAKKDLPKWVGEQFARLGASADRDACRALVEAVGDDVGDLASEIQKLATWANGDPITQANVEELAVGPAETPIFALTDSWGRRDVAATLRATESLLDRSHRPRSGELIRIVASLVSHVGRVRKASRLADEGVRSSEIASRLKLHPFVAEKAAKQGGNFSPDELSQATVRLAELDAGAKGGSRLPAELQLERTLVEITRRPDARD